MTELIWDSKYKDSRKQGPVRIELPFQTIETVNETAQDRRRSLQLFESGRDADWRNRLIWGDKKYVLPSLLSQFAGKVNLIYIDPPYATGADFSFPAQIPKSPRESDDAPTEFTKEPSVLEQKAYRDTWGRGLDSYLQWLYETGLILRDLLAEDGTLYVHLDWHVCSYAKVLLDEIFGVERCRNEIIWKRSYGHGDSRRSIGRSHDTLLLYTKSEEFTLNRFYHKHDPQYVEGFFKHEDKRGRYKLENLTSPSPRPNLTYSYKGYPPPAKGWRVKPEVMAELDREDRLYFPKKQDGRIMKKVYLQELEGQPMTDLWTDIPLLSAHDQERVGYPTQKPPALLERIINASSNEGDLVFDCFLGSGTTAIASERLNRRWIGCDLSRFAIHTTRKRLLGISDVTPFVVQNLGKYERQAWQSAEFPNQDASQLTAQRRREASYRTFILDLYRAQPVTGYAWLHGVRNGRMVHIGAVDAPITLADVKSISREAWKALGGVKSEVAKAAVDILGWDFAFEVNELAKQIAAESRVTVTFRKIPREVLDKKAVEQGDVKFFEMGALSLEAKVKKSREVTLKVSDFVIPTDDIPEEARQSIKHWSQLVDYWAVDWDYRGDSFHNEWQAYRTRKTPKIELDTKHTYDRAGAYKIVVKVIDILGNDTTTTREITVA